MVVENCLQRKLKNIDAILPKPLHKLFLSYKSCGKKLFLGLRLIFLERRLVSLEVLPKHFTIAAGRRSYCFIKANFNKNEKLGPLGIFLNVLPLFLFNFTFLVFHR